MAEVDIVLFGNYDRQTDRRDATDRPGEREVWSIVAILKQKRKKVKKH